MDDLKIVLDQRRAEAGHNGSPMTWESWGQRMGVLYTSLFKFSRGKAKLGPKSVRTLAKRAQENNDKQLLSALASYALSVRVKADFTDSEN